MQYQKLEEQIISLVHKAGDLVKDATFEISQKQAKENIVTTSDLKVQKYLQEELVKLMPTSGFYCEEEDFKDTASEWIWVIDPIDGTANYSRQIGEWGISVALLKNGKGVVGVVYNPVCEETFSAIKGGGARLNGKPISTSKKPFKNGLFCTAMSLYDKSLAKICNDIIFETYMQCNDVRRFGSCALELCYLAVGRCELFFEIRVFPWDYAGAILILQEAGGVVKSLNGENLRYTGPSPVIGANSLENYEKLNAIVQKHLTKIPY